MTLLLTLPLLAVLLVCILLKEVLVWAVGVVGYSIVMALCLLIIAAEMVVARCCRPHTRAPPSLQST